MSIQRLEKDVGLARPYSLGPYNRVDDKEQWIRLSEGCVHQCPYCYEPPELKIFPTPEIVRTRVKIMDMNLLCHSEAHDILESLPKHLGSTPIHYEMICGIDYRFLDEDIAFALKEHRFDHVRIAWDWWYRDQFKILDALKILDRAGYQRRDLMVFMLANWRIPLAECLKKTDLCKVWRVKVADCYFDNQTFPHIQGVHWTTEACREFRRKVRKHNQLVLFGFDPQLPKEATR